MQLLGVVFVHDYITSEYASLNLSQVSEIKKKYVLFKNWGQIHI